MLIGDPSELHDAYRNWQPLEEKVLQQVCKPPVSLKQIVSHWFLVWTGQTDEEKVAWSSTCFHVTWPEK